MDKKTFKMLQALALANTTKNQALSAIVEPEFTTVYTYDTVSTEVNDVPKSVEDKFVFTVEKYLANEDTKRVQMYFQGDYGIIRVIQNDGLECDYTILED